ncbi:family 16 glycosylhydrolase [Marinilabiliaceae bacterium ANBcel2]|nr:family 16 glycosylhydrolase [Marinilabiliaceae bacterium ANBcel2]
MIRLFFTLLLILSYVSAFGQTLKDDFEGDSTIDTWYADDCLMDTSYSNPFIDEDNNSAKVLRYEDTGGQYANIGFNTTSAINITDGAIFSLKIYVPSDGITGNQPNQISLKLQNGNLAEPWSTQSEIIKPIVLDEWQEVTFDFINDTYINLNPNSPSPNQRSDFNRVVIQLNGEDNNDKVIGYIDDFYFESEVLDEPNDPIYDVLVWSDEFDVDGSLDDSKWHHQTLLPDGDSWFNDEIQHYTDRIENSYVENGVMHLVAKKETFTDQGVTKDFTSARLNSKFAFTYGRVEVKAKLPTGVGTWPAIWMLGKNISEKGGYWYDQYGDTPWPYCGEIDIMEHWGHNQNFVQSAMHTPSSYGGTVNHGGQEIPTVSTQFHVYALDWYPDRMVFSVDDVVHYTYQPGVRDADTWPFDNDQYLLLNVAIQPRIEDSFTESAMEIEYVRIYQDAATSTQRFETEQLLEVSSNPKNSTARIISSNEGVGSDIYIYNIHGHLIKKSSIISTETIIDMSGWNKGVYVLKHNGAGSGQNYKIINN